MFSRAVGWLGTACVLTGAGAAYEATRLRPRRRDELAPDAQAQYVDIPLPGDAESTLLRVARTGTIGLVSLLSRAFLTHLNDVVVYDQHKLHEALLHRPRGMPLLTVANHASTLDDPGLVSVLVPTSVLMDHNAMRWGLCSQELCFPSAALAAFFGAGKVLPIRRGETVEQPELQVFGRRFRHGDWLHIFPEGRVWQEVGSPPRDAHARQVSSEGRNGKPYSKLGPLKWGVGRLVLEASPRPLILPFFHMGMEAVMPQDENNDLISMVPTRGNRVHVLVGDPVDVADIAREYDEYLATHRSMDDTVRYDFYRRATERIEQGLWRTEEELLRRMERDGAEPPHAALIRQQQQAAEQAPSR